MLFAVCFNCQNSPAQNFEKIDSLKKCLESADTDTGKVFLLHDLYWEYRRSDLDKALEYAQKSLELSKNIDFSKGIAISNYKIGITHKNRGDLDKALNYLSIARSICDSINLKRSLGNVLNELGSVYKKKGNLQMAVNHFMKALKIFEQSSDTSQLSRIYSLLGNIYQYQKQYDKALDHHEKSLQLNNILDFEIGISANYNNIGNVYKELDQLDKALEYYNKSLEIKEKVNDVMGTASSYNNIGLIYLENGEYARAKEIHMKALSLNKELNNENGISLCLINIGYDYLCDGGYDEAIKYTKQGLTLARSNGQKEIETEACSILSKAYASIGRYKDAYEFHLQYITEKDSMFNEETARLISEMESKHEIEKRENEIALLNADHEKQELKLQKHKVQRYFLIGTVIFILIILFFIYNRYRIKQKTSQKLREINEVKSRFFANLSHEFRTPLTLILGPLEKMIEDPDIKESKLFRMMYRNAMRLLVLNNQLLDLSKLEAGQLTLKAKLGNIAEPLKAMAYSFSSLAEQRDICYDIEVSQAEIQMYFDADKLEKIVYNLLSNAFKFTPDKGQINFLVSSDFERTGVYRIKPAQMNKRIDNSHLIIKVSDSGQGIDEQKIDKIFDRFYQIDGSLTREHEGAGIGLALTRELVELHHGTITVTSKKGHGSVFTVKLPMGDNIFSPDEISVDEVEKVDLQGMEDLFFDEPGSQDEPRQADGRSGQLPIILIVEDNADMRGFISDHLEKGYQIQEAENGKSGLEKALKLIPDIIITDLMMPVMDGMEFCEKIKTDEKTSHIPVIMLTALSSVEDKIKGLETGADDYMPKPFNSQELNARIRNLVGQRMKLRQRYRKEFKIQPSDISVTSADEKFLNKIIRVIEENMSNPDFDVETLISEVNMSRAQLYRKIKALTDQSTTEFIRTQRLQRAAQLFEQHYGSIAETTYAVGFNNLSYFTRCFKKLFNMTPSEYIEQKCEKK